MKPPTHSGGRKLYAFTLIELLVVIAIITVLAALTFPTVQGIKESATRKKVKTELQQVVTAIESYKAKYGFYPPDNPCKVGTHQLFFELSGVTTLNDGVSYETLDNSARITNSSFAAVFGNSGGQPCVGGLVNVTRGAGSDDAPSATAFLKGLKPGQYADIKISGVSVRMLTCSESGFGDSLNPWRYNSSSPTNNSSSYDLWADVFIGGKTNRISNWSEQPQFVN